MHRIRISDKDSTVANGRSRRAALMSMRAVRAVGESNPRWMRSADTDTRDIS